VWCYAVLLLSSISQLQKRWLLFSAGSVLVPWYWCCVVRSRFCLMRTGKRKKKKEMRKTTLSESQTGGLKIGAVNE
jgi:hypothetical protein